HKLARALKAGSVWVNCYQAMDPAVPFGGWRKGVPTEVIPGAVARLFTQ
ncbi:MAG: aldehyde dehydrogenase family protein, partial [Proteobacteria bacterium]|nr:aldehyde dehydrogenase family protein [Pseudomonadota bacterium]